MKAIFSVDKNWGIGYKGELLKRIPEDMRFFKQTTMDKVVVMGRKTFESLPGGEPLKGRVNIVLSRDTDFNHQGVTVCRSIDGLHEILKNYSSDDIYIIGGAQIYKQLMPYYSEAIVTRFEAAFTADSYFPDMDREEGWTSEAISGILEYEGLKYFRVKYINNRQWLPFTSPHA